MNKKTDINNIDVLKEVISKIDSSSCPNSINLHCHTLLSDGSLQPLQLIEQAYENRLEHIAVTDHHSIEAYQVMQEWLSLKRDSEITPPVLWSGIEISCLLKKCLVHVLGLGIDVNNPSLRPYIQGDSAIGMALKATSVVSAIREAGGISILAHPARYRLGWQELINEAHDIGMDGAESWYDYEYKSEWIPTPYLCERIDKHLLSIGMLRTCGTDTHGLYLGGR